MERQFNAVIPHNDDDFFAEVPTPAPAPARPLSNQGIEVGGGQRPLGQAQPPAQTIARESSPNFGVGLPPSNPPQAYQTYLGSIQSQPGGERRFNNLPSEQVEPQRQRQQSYNNLGLQQAPQPEQRQRSVGRYNPLLNSPNLQVQNQIQRQNYPPQNPNSPFQANPLQTNLLANQNDSIQDQSRLSNQTRGSHRSPLRTNVLNAIPGLNPEGMRKSASGRNLNEIEYPDDVGQLKIIYLARNDELKHLHEQIAILEGRNQPEAASSDNKSEQEIARLEKEYNDLLLTNDLLKRELEQAKAAVRNTTNDFDLKLAQMRGRLQENARKNTELYERELMFKYRNNDDETIKFLREKIAQYEKR